MADVFLSYKREDEAKVRKLVAALRHAGLETWWDEDIPPSAPWEATIEQELGRAKAVIVCWSPAAVASDNVRSEARVAREDGRLIQVFLKPCQPPLFFGEQQALDVSKWRGNADDPRIARLTETARKVAAGEQVERAERSKARRSWLDRRVYAALAAFVLLAGSLAGWWLLAPARAQGPQTLAVLPFRALNPADANLVDAIWDDTRGAISKNPNLRVLGREAVTALAKKDLTPADYRKKVGADYLLDGSVEHVGDQVRMKLSLTRTNDGSEVWSDEIAGKLDDVFVFQQQVAREVEGRIRGRVAPGAGVKAQNIATTGEVYAIYADARARLRKRDSDDFQAAIALLKKALAIDPNYAPAWASLGQATGTQISRGSLQRQGEAVSYLNRALQLAPNLAHAHAAIAMVQNSPPELESELRKAVQLDPNDAEAWGWLANCLQTQNRLQEALVARNRTVEIEPLWYWAATNKISTLSMLRDWKGIDAEIARVKATGDPVLLAKTQIMAAAATEHPGDQMRMLLQLRIAHPEESSWVDNRLFDPMMTLGFVDEAMATARLPVLLVQTYRGIPPSPEAIKQEFPKPLDIWTNANDAIALWGRELPRHGRIKEYLNYYDTAFRSPDELLALWEHRPIVFRGTVPTLAAVLREAGRGDDADAILHSAEQRMQPVLRNGPPSIEQLAALAYLRGAEEHGDEAVSLLGKAVAQGWLPDRRFAASDIADEPCFARLVTRPDFQAIRQRILARVQEERGRVPSQLLAQAGFASKRAA